MTFIIIYNHIEWGNITDYVSPILSFWNIGTDTLLLISESHIDRQHHLALAITGTKRS